MANFAALTSVAAEGTTSAEGAAAVALEAGTRTVFVGAGADIVCRRKGNLSNIFYAGIVEAAIALGSGLDFGSTVAFGSTVGVNKISF